MMYWKIKRLNQWSNGPNSAHTEEPPKTFLITNFLPHPYGEDKQDINYTSL